jgi:glycosyltransferase involved in cell wall biosynthesis
MITTFYPPYSFGGDAIYVQQLSNELAKRGHHVTIIHCLDSYNLLSSRESPTAYQNHSNVDVYGLKSEYGFLSPLATQQTGRPFFKSDRIREILDSGYDVIHFHNISLVGGPKILEYGQGIKLYTIHEYWLVCPTHMLMRFRRAPCERPFCIACQLIHKRPPQVWRYTNLLESSLSRVGAIISPSKFTKKIHEDRGLKFPIAHIPPFAPDHLNSPDQFNENVPENPQEPYFLYVGRLEKLKGVHTLIPIFKRYKKADLIIAGEGQYEDYIRKLAEGCENIHVLGHVSHDRLRKLYEKAAALIVPSMTYEISTLVIFESFREKTPVIVRNIGGMPEVIDESGAGLIYDSDKELVESMDLLLDDTSYRQKLGILGYEGYLAKWNPESHLRQYFELIQATGPT